MDYLTHILSLNLQPGDALPVAVVAPRLPGRFEPVPSEGALGGSTGFGGWMPIDVDGETDTAEQDTRPAAPRRQPASLPPAVEAAPYRPSRPAQGTPTRLNAPQEAPPLEPVRPATTPRPPEGVLSFELPAAEPFAPGPQHASPIPRVPFVQPAGQAQLTPSLAPVALSFAQPASMETERTLSPAPPPARHPPAPAPVPVEGQSPRPAASRLEPASAEPRHTAVPAPPPASPSETVIHINIGRIEVKASPTPGEKPARARQPAVVMTLEEYLQRRRGKGDER